ncbi:hypothetical protein GCM10017620_24310 [Brevundimonas intermedia]|uniref:DUF3887 domain-containing protein n=1 Tax=Brevundimonas intermedia TaxID=74315 RepID=A0ABQ5TAQ8_9CAUL|nr:hypothetical protein [Brevundimonas intermedia]GLK49458.1 hypothetical protein GCM10017620_24310 [Brevundimonas intermedia]
MKTKLIKTVLAAALFAAPVPALAQAAAGSVPNAFDAAPAPAPAPVQAPAPTAAQAPDIARAEAALRGVIAAVQGAGFDYSVFTPDLATRMRQLSPEISPLIKSFGAVRTVEFQKAEGDAQLFRVTFDNQVTEWMILFDPEDRIAGLRFRPVEA